MNKEEKTTEIQLVRDRFAKSQALFFAENVGLKAGEISDLRKKLRTESILFRVIKNRLVKRALSDSKIGGLDPFFKGPTAIVSTETDGVLLAKRLVDYTKTSEKLKLKGGYMQGEVLDLNKIKRLASLPSREELYAKLLGCLQNPSRGVVSVLAAIPRQLVTVINGIKEKKS